MSSKAASDEQKPGDPQWASGAWQLAEEIANKQLIRVWGSVENGMVEIGKRSYAKWVDRIENEIESENPK